jgi:DNA-binding response OmpR family regulator
MGFMAVLVAVRDLLLRSRISEVAQRIGVPVVLARRGFSLSESARTLGRGTALVDLSEPGILGELQQVKAQGGVRVIGFLGHLQTELAAAALEAGADEVLSRGQLVGRLEDVLRAGAAADAGAPSAR